MKPAILILSIVGILGLAIGIVLYVLGTAAIVAQCQNVLNDQAQLQACLQQNAASGAGQILGGFAGLIIGGLCAFIAWILGLVKTASIGRWGWFVLVLLISPLGSLIYGIAGPTERAVPAMAGMPPYQQ